jgi:hypothetical protein
VFSPTAPPVCCSAVRLQGSSFLVRAFLIQMRFSFTQPPGTASPVPFLGGRFLDMTARQPFCYSFGAGFLLLRAVSSTSIHSRPLFSRSSLVCRENLLGASPVFIYAPVLPAGGLCCWPAVCSASPPIPALFWLSLQGDAFLEGHLFNLDGRQCLSSSFAW